MQVECPHCNTLFKVTDDHLRVADGMVRCGLCHDVFNALADKDEAREQTAETADPQAAKHDQAAASSDSDTENVSATINETDNSDLFEGVQSKLIPDEYRIPDIKRHYSIWRDIAWSVAILALTISLFAEYTWFNRNQLVTRPELKPWLTQLCHHIDCNRLELRDPGEIEMLARNIYSHPNISQALMVSVTMINHAAFAQPYPDINIDFSDVRGKVVASRTFSPGEYLQNKPGSDDLLSPSTATDFHLEIQDPGDQALTYEFSFL